MVGLRMKHEETCVAAGKQKNYNLNMEFTSAASLLYM